jgi:hypothetical protein
MRPTLPESPPRGRQTLGELRRLQRLTGRVILRPLGADFQSQKTWTDGRDMNAVVGGFIKPNDRLSSFERIEIYNRQYWYRLIDSLYDDFPGLRAVLGDERFSLLTRAYLGKYPSRSFSLRNLGRSLPRFLEEEPRWGRPVQRMAQDMARFEWAKVVAFDGPALPPITAEDLAGRDPGRLRLALQPYVTLLDLAYPLDKFSTAIKKQAIRGEASNAMEEHSPAKRASKVRRPRARRTFVAIHRFDNDVYYRRLEPSAFRILTALSGGATLVDACRDASPRKVKQWFMNWSTLGWFCKRR